MPRKPTEKVIEHRITLGTYERQMFSDAVTSYNFKNTATPIVAALSDVSFLIFVGGAIGIFLDRLLPRNSEYNWCWNRGCCGFIRWQSCCGCYTRDSSG